MPDPPQRCPWTCEYVSLHGRKDFADVIKVKELEMGRLSWIILVSSIRSHESLKIEKEGQRVGQRDKTWKLYLPLLALKMEEGGHKPKKVLASKAGKGKVIDSPLETPEENEALLTP